MKKTFTLILILSLVLSLCSGCLARAVLSGLEEGLSEYVSEAASGYDDSDFSSDVWDSEETDYDDTEITYQEGDDTWTVLLYLCGTDLESNYGAATSNLSELCSVPFNEGVNFLVQTGGTKRWQNQVVDASCLQRYQVKDGGLTLLDEQNLASMGDPDTLADFIRWGAKTCPADKYALIFWNHGGGSVSGLEFDECFGYDSLSLKELDEGLKSGGATFEFIGFDTCLMASLENAVAIAPYAKYMVASEETEPGGGWDYASWPRYILNNPGCTGLEAGTSICDSYYKKCARSGEGDMATLSVIELSKIPALAASFDKMAVEMTGVTADIDSLRTFAQSAVKAESYGGNTQSEGYTNMVDLGDLAVNTENVLSDTAETVLDDLFSAVKYQKNGASRSGANGISVFFPLGVDNKTCDAYANIAFSGNYLRFLDAVNKSWNAPAWVDEMTDAPVVESVSEEDYQVEAESYIDEDGYYSLEILSGLEAVESVTFNLFYMDYEYNEYMLLGSDNDIDADWDSGLFVDNFRGVWPTIDGQYCAPVLIAEEEDYNLYSIPILLNGEETNLRAAWVWDSDTDGHYEIYGAWAGLDSDTGMSARNIVQLEDGDEVTLLFDGQNWDTGESTTYAMGSFTVSGAVTMEESELFDGEYLYEFVIKDVFGNELFSNPVILEVKDGDINVFETE